MTFLDQFTNAKCGSTIFLPKPFLEQWFACATAGAKLTYATGDLAYDRRAQVDQGGLLNATANYAHKLARQGYVDLTQRKLGASCYEYRIRKK